MVPESESETSVTSETPWTSSATLLTSCPVEGHGFFEGGGRPPPPPLLLLDGFASDALDGFATGLLDGFGLAGSCLVCGCNITRGVKTTAALFNPRGPFFAAGWASGTPRTSGTPGTSQASGRVNGRTTNSLMSRKKSAAKSKFPVTDCTSFARTMAKPPTSCKAQSPKYSITAFQDSCT